MAAEGPKPRAQPPAVDLAAALDHSLIDASVIDKGGYAYLIHPLLDGVPRCPPELLEAWVQWAAAQPPCAEATLLLAPEAMGLPLVAALSLRLGLPYAIIRKRAYHLPGEQVAYCETGYGGAVLHVNDVTPLDRVLVIDDVLSTGGTLGAILATLREMAVPVAGALVAVDKGTARAILAVQHGIPISAMRTVKVTLKGLQIVERG